MSVRSAILVAILATHGALAVSACTDDEAAHAESDAGTDASIDTSPPVVDSGAADVRDAADAHVDVPPLTIQCSVTPCALELAMAGASTCALLEGGTVRCWGADDYGQLGRGPIDGGWDTNTVPVVDLEGVIQLSAGPDGYCATLAPGDVKCWGNDSAGQLGSPDQGGAKFSAVPRRVEDLPKARAAFMGDGLACAALEDGDAMCWGTNSYGRIPDLADASQGRQAPTKVDLGGRLIRAIAPGDQAVVVLADDGTLLSWGKRSRPMSWEVTTLGREVSLDPAWPAPLASPAYATALAGMGPVACAASNGGALRWGGLEGSTGPISPTPVSFTTSAKVRGVSIGQGGQFCAVLDDKTARCLGDNTYGQLGNGDYVSSRLTPVAVRDLPASPARIVTAYDHACAILENGAVMCWGNNEHGQLGTGDYGMHPTPTPVRFSP